MKMSVFFLNYFNTVFNPAKYTVDFFLNYQKKKRHYNFMTVF